MKSLFFAALILPPDLCEQVQAIKLEFSRLYGTRHGLHTVPHITILPPFHADEIQLEQANRSLAEHAATVYPIEVKLDGFGKFGDDVLYIRVIPSPSIQELYEAFQGNSHRPSHAFHPHVTIAHRDLPEGCLKKVWPDYEQRRFTGRFKCESISLLKLEDGFWKRSADFPLGMISP